MTGKCMRLWFVIAVAVTGCGGGSSGGDVSLRISSAIPGDASTRVPFELQLTAVNAGTNSLQWNLAVKPPGMNVSLGGLVTWQPTEDDIGLQSVVVELVAGPVTLTQEWNIRVHQGLAMGTALSPRGFEGSSTAQDYIDHYSGHDPWGEAIAFHGNWRDSVITGGQVPALATNAMTFSRQYGFTPVIGIGWTISGTPDLTSTSEPTNNTWSNAETRAEFLAMVTTLAQLERPPYLFLGNETNAYFVDHTQAQWDDWISMFELCYDAIKAVSPNTIVYTTFQLELLKGMGVLNGWNDPPQWQLIADHAGMGKIDAIGFTSYPYFDHATPSAIPNNYYDEISQYWTGPVIFSEIGWKAQATVPYAGDPTQQKRFIQAFFKRTDDLDLEMVNWLFLHDWDGQAGEPAFQWIGLRNNDASVIRPADLTWRNTVALRQR